MYLWCELLEFVKHESPLLIVILDNVKVFKKACNISIESVLVGFSLK